MNHNDIFNELQPLTIQHPMLGNIIYGLGNIGAIMLWVITFGDLDNWSIAIKVGVGLLSGVLVLLGIWVKYLELKAKMREEKAYNEKKSEL